jgi:hypothetical protein
MRIACLGWGGIPASPALGEQQDPTPIKVKTTSALTIGLFMPYVWQSTRSFWLSIQFLMYEI